MSIPSIHAEKVADIRFRNEEGGRTKEGRKDSSFAFLSHSASAIVSQSARTDRRTDRAESVSPWRVGVRRDVW